MNAKDVLSLSLEKRLRHAMVQTLDEFDERFDDLSDTDRGRLFKVDLKNMFNDIIRANRDEISDYAIAYKPLRFRPDNVLWTTNEFMESIELVTFSNDTHSQPWIKIWADPTKAAVLDAIRSEFAVGLAYFEDEKIVFGVSGIEDCLKLVPFLDRYRLTAGIGQKYRAWRNNLVHLYIRS